MNQFHDPNQDKLMNKHLTEIEGMNTDNPQVIYRYKLKPNLRSNITNRQLLLIHPTLRSERKNYADICDPRVHWLREPYPHLAIIFDKIPDAATEWEEETS